MSLRCRVFGHRWRAVMRTGPSSRATLAQFFLYQLDTRTLWACRRCPATVESWLSDPALAWRLQQREPPPPGVQP